MNSAEETKLQSRTIAQAIGVSIVPPAVVCVVVGISVLEPSTGGRSADRQHRWLWWPSRAGAKTRTSSFR